MKRKSKANPGSKFHPPHNFADHQGMQHVTGSELGTTPQMSPTPMSPDASLSMGINDQAPGEY